MKIVRKFGNKTFNLDLLKKSKQIIIDELKIPMQQLILMEQIHSNQIKIICEEQVGVGILQKPIPGVDGLITNTKNVFFAIKTADCIPIFLWDEKQEVIAALHSGRVGTEQNICRNAVELMIEKFGCDPKNIRVELGPAICGNCYPVDRNSFDIFVQKTRIEQTFPNLNLEKVIVSNLLEMGVLPENIWNYSICTKEDFNYFSFRENQTTERQISIIGMV